MRASLLGLVILLAGCIADIRPAIYATNKHVEAIIDTTRAAHVPLQERMVLVSFHATRARGWTVAMLKHKGDPDPQERLTIPRSPEDRREIAEEDLLKKEYEADIATEDAIKKKGLGWLTTLCGVGGAGTMSGLLAMFMRYKKKVVGMLQAKDRAIDEYDSAIDTLPKAKRTAIATGPNLKREHAVRRNGGGTA